MSQSESIKKAFEAAKEQYAAMGVDVEAAMDQLDKFPISLHCWQADDVGGFETPNSSLSGGGIQATGNYPGKATNISEHRMDLEKAMSLIPGKQRLNLHAIYGDFQGELVDRDQIELKHFQSWIDWAKDQGIGMDFNCSVFSHPKASDDLTLSHKNKDIRDFWIEHTKRCRAIGAEMGKQLGSPSIHNIWIQDGSKDLPVDRYAHRAILKDSLDEIFAEKYSRNHLKDAIESKLFGIGLEAMTVGNSEFYLGYAVANQTLICLDSGHFHPTEQVGDKISSALLFVPESLLHVTRPIRWDSDHVVTFNDDTTLIAQEIVRCNALDRVHMGLDFFDASINRIGAYVVGTRAAQQAMLFALLEPREILLEYEEKGQFFERLAMLELLKTKPFGAIWDYYCMKLDVPVAQDFIADIQQYEKDVLSKRS
ncbi:MAG: L-rhamnose isomerase [Bacteroidetes bacterium]|nr:MAG: L-rhamnose isomerase [Bacteroidota bacterium]